MNKKKDKDKDEDNDEKENENLLSSSQIPACKAKSGRANVNPGTFVFVLAIFGFSILFQRFLCVSPKQGWVTGVVEENQGWF